MVADTDTAKDPGQRGGPRRKHDSLDVESNLQIRFPRSLFFHLISSIERPSCSPNKEPSSPFMDVVELIEKHLSLSLNAPNPSPGSPSPPPIPPPLPSAHLPARLHRLQIEITHGR